MDAHSPGPLGEFVGAKGRYKPMEEVLGSGAFSVVRLGKRVDDGLEVAIKRVDQQSIKSKRVTRPSRVVELLREEMSILRDLDHPNVIALLDSHETARSFTMVIELCQGGDLEQMIKARRTLTLPNIRHIMVQLCMALDHIHSRNIVHRDIKPANILFVSKGSTAIKLADFGMSRRVSQDMASTVCGSPYYMAPEVMTGIAYDRSADLWSVGVMTYRCLTGNMPFQAKTVKDLTSIYKSIDPSDPEPIDFPKDADPALVNFIARILRVDPGSRVTATFMLNNDPFLREFKKPTIVHNRIPGAVIGLRMPAAPFCLPGSAPATPVEPPSSFPSVSTMGHDRRQISGSYVVVDRDHVAVNQMADRPGREERPLEQGRQLKERLILLEAMCDAMAFHRPSHLREFIVACHMLKMLKETKDMSAFGSRTDVNQFRQLFNQCIERIEDLRSGLHQSPPNTEGTKPPSASKLLYKFAKEIDSCPGSSDPIHRAERFTKSIAIYEHLKAQTMAAGNSDAADHLAESVRSTCDQLESLTKSCVRFCGSCGHMFAPSHNFCQGCGQRREMTDSTPMLSSSSWSRYNMSHVD